MKSTDESSDCFWYSCSGPESESPVSRTVVIWKRGWWISSRSGWLLELLTEQITEKERDWEWCRRDQSLLWWCFPSAIFEIFAICMLIFIKNCFLWVANYGANPFLVLNVLYEVESRILIRKSLSNKQRKSSTCHFEQMYELHFFPSYLHD